MSELVVNNIVKMEWKKNRFVQTVASKGKQATFIMACQEYKNKNGDIVPVFFTGTTAWLHFDEQGLYTFAELKDFVKSNFDQSFPEVYTEYHEIATNPSSDVNMELLEEYGIEEYADDIIERLRDLQPYAEETTVDM